VIGPGYEPGEFEVGVAATRPRDSDKNISFNELGANLWGLYGALLGVLS
jgi:hypothetical protein